MTRVILRAAERAALTALARDEYAHRRARERARMVLLVADGWTREAVAAELGRCSKTVGNYVRDYAREGLAPLFTWKDRGSPRGGPPLDRQRFGPLVDRLLADERLWTVGALREAVARETGCRATFRELRALLTFGRERHVHDA